MTDLHRLSFQTDEGRINGVVIGSGPPILLLHGLGLSWEWWRPALDALADRFTVCAIDLPGSGGSSPVVGRASDQQHADLVRQSLAAFALEPALIVGHSLGGYIATQAAIQGVPGIKGLVLASPAGFGRVHHPGIRLLSQPVAAAAFRLGDRLNRHASRRLRRLTLRAALRTLVRDPSSITDEMLTWADVSPHHRDQFLYQIRLGIDLRGHTYMLSSPEEIRSLTLPVSLIWGRHDPVFPFAVAERANALLRPAEFHVFERSGHMPQLEEPDRFHSLVHEFAASV